MNGYSGAFGTRYWRPAILLFIVLAVLGPQNLHADSSGLKIGIQVTSDLDQLQIPLGWPVGLTMLISNDTDWPIYTKLGFSQSEFYRALLLTGPNGGKYIYISENEKVDTMPPPIPFGSRQVVLAEELGLDFVKEVVIDDLGQLFPMIDTEPGWYTIEARLPFMRFAEIIPIKNFGVLGPVDDIDNIWRGSVISNKIQFYRYPATGGQVTVRVLESSAEQSVPLFQAPVKLFKSADVNAADSLEAAWTKAKVVLEGTTNNDGQTTWSSGTTTCLIGDDYTIIARSAEDYQDSTIAAGDSGWQQGCAGLIARDIVFAGQEEPPPAIAGDLDEDGDVDRNDLNSILAARNTPASGPDDPRDIDADGMITVLDARKLVLLCTRPRCAVE